MMELPNVATTYHTALHGPWTPPQQGAYSVSTSGPAGVDLSADYHNCWVTRQPGVIVIGVDGWVRGIYTVDDAARCPVDVRRAELRHSQCRRLR
jgi:hypothetical protein